MNKRDLKKLVFGLLIVAGSIALLAGCDSSSAGGNTGSSTCDDTTTHTVEWKFSGSYTDGVSVATTWVKPSGEFSDPSDLQYVSIDPAGGTLLTETLPGCSGASINITMLDDIVGSDSDDTVTLTNVTLSIYVDGTLADSVSLNGTYNDGDILPSSGALTIVVGQ